MQKNGINLSKDIIEKQGNKILSENRFMIGLNKIMSNPEYIKFMNEFAKDWHDIKTIILYQKLYQSVKEQYYKKYKTEIPIKLLMVILVKLFENKKVRSIIMERYLKFINNGKYENLIDLKNNSYNNLLLLN